MVRKKIKTFITLSLICFFAIKILVANSLRFENLLIQINIYLSVRSGMRNNNKKTIRAKRGKNCLVIKFEKKLTLAITESTKEAGFLGFGGTNHRSKKEINIQYNIQIQYYIGYVIQKRWFLLPMEMDKFCRRPSCLVN